MTPHQHSDSLGLESPKRLWVVCESGERWLTASRRFATTLIPEDLVAKIVRANPSEVQVKLVSQQRAVVLWEIDGDNLPDIASSISQISSSGRDVLQLAAVSSIAPRDLFKLSELGIAASIRRPERLPSLANLVQRFFGGSV